MRMRLSFRDSFQRDYQHLPQELQRTVDEALARLLENPRHPSLRTKKMRGAGPIWELRVTRGYRITFEIQGDLYDLRRVGTHDILRSP